MPKKVARSRENSARPPLERMLAIHNELAADRYPNCSGLAAKLEVSAKTIQRDIDFMRDRMNLPLAYDPVRHGFYYTELVSNFPTVQVSQGELVALLVAQKAAEQYRGTPFERPLASAFSKLAAGLQDETGISLHEVTEAISFRPQGVAVTELESFQKLAEAVVKQQNVEFEYRGLHGERAATRHVRPYHLGCLANQWYLIGHDVDREALRTFALTRLNDVTMTAEKFERPAGFSVNEMFEGSFSAFQSSRVERIVLRVDAFAARLAMERKWHPTQTLVEKKDGTTLLTLDVSPAPDLENWILGWGDHAEVLKPLALRRTIAATVTAMAKVYASEPMPKQ